MFGDCVWPLNLTFVFAFFSALVYTHVEAINCDLGWPHFHPHFISESVPLLPSWLCRNRWSLSVGSICTSGTGRVPASSLQTHRTWMLALIPVSARPSSLLVTKTGWILWIRHRPLTRQQVFICYGDRVHGNPISSKIGWDCISQTGHSGFDSSTLWNGIF